MSVEIPSALKGKFRECMYSTTNQSFFKCALVLPTLLISRLENEQKLETRENVEIILLSLFWFVVPSFFKHLFSPHIPLSTQAGRYAYVLFSKDKDSNFEWGGVRGENARYYSLFASNSKSVFTTHKWHRGRSVYTLFIPTTYTYYVHTRYTIYTCACLANRLEGGRPTNKRHYEEAPTIKLIATHA